MDDLKFRIGVTELAIRTLEAEKVDPRAPDALKHYRQQLKELQDQLAALENKPPDIVVGLKTAELFPRSEK